MARTVKDATISFRLPVKQKALIEDAAAVEGQSVSGYARAVLVKASEEALQRARTTVLSNRDRAGFTALLDDAASQPNLALAIAARRYRKQFT